MLRVLTSEVPGMEWDLDSKGNIIVAQKGEFVFTQCSINFYHSTAIEVICYPSTLSMIISSERLDRVSKAFIDVDHALEFSKAQNPSLFNSPYLWYPFLTNTSTNIRGLTRKLIGNYN